MTSTTEIPSTHDAQEEFIHPENKSAEENKHGCSTPIDTR